MTRAVPFSCHPPDTGDGIATGAAAAGSEIDKPTTAAASEMVAAIATALRRRAYLRDASRRLAIMGCRAHRKVRVPAAQDGSVAGKSDVVIFLRHDSIGRCE
jgi:hypothetical protein